MFAASPDTVRDCSAVRTMPAGVARLIANHTPETSCNDASAIYPEARIVI